MKSKYNFLSCLAHSSSLTKISTLLKRLKKKKSGFPPFFKRLIFSISSRRNPLALFIIKLSLPLYFHSCFQPASVLLVSNSVRQLHRFFHFRRIIEVQSILAVANNESIPSYICFYCISLAMDAAKRIWLEITADETKASF